MTTARMLIDREILALADNGIYLVTPLVHQNIMPASIDLRIANERIRFTGEFITLGDERDESLWVKEPFDHLEIPSGETAVVSMKETISMPEDCAGIVLPRSSITRNSVIVQNIYINPGYTGSPSLTIVNHANVPVAIAPETRVAQLVVFKLGALPKRIYSDVEDAKYLGEDAAAPRMSKDAEITELLRKIVDHELPTTFERIVSDK